METSRGAASVRLSLANVVLEIFGSEMFVQEQIDKRIAAILRELAELEAIEAAAEDASDKLRDAQDVYKAALKVIRKAEQLRESIRNASMTSSRCITPSCLWYGAGR
jgi:hypothetical protein